MACVSKAFFDDAMDKKEDDDSLETDVSLLSLYDKSSYGGIWPKNKIPFMILDSVS